MSPVSSVSDSAQPDNVTAYAEPRIFALIVGIDEVLDLRIVIHDRYLDHFSSGDPKTSLP